MKRILLIILVIVVVLGSFAAVGFAGYRYGYSRGAETVARDGLGIRPFDGLGPRGMWMHEFGFGRGLLRERGRGGFPMMGFGFFSPLMLLGRLAVLALILGLLYWLFARSGWRLTRADASSAAPPPPAESDVRDQDLPAGR